MYFEGSLRWVPVPAILTPVPAPAALLARAPRYTVHYVAQKTSTQVPKYSRALVIGPSTSILPLHVKLHPASEKDGDRERRLIAISITIAIAIVTIMSALLPPRDREPDQQQRIARRLLHSSASLWQGIAINDVSVIRAAPSEIVVRCLSGKEKKKMPFSERDCDRSSSRPWSGIADHRVCPPRSVAAKTLM